MININSIDLVVITIYILFIVWWGIKKGKSGNSNDYFLAGRDLKWPMVGLSLFAASISSSTLMGNSGEGFINGIAVFNYNWISILVMVFFAMFFLPFYIKSGIFTMPEFLERRFDGRSRAYFSFITIIGNVFLDAAATLYAGALIISMIFPNIQMTSIIIGMAIVAGSYTIIGGLSSVINTEVIQAFVLVIGSTLLAVFSMEYIGGWEVFLEKFNDGVWLKLTRPMSDTTVPWLGMWVGIPILGFYFWGNNQVMVQRVLSAKSIDQGRKGVLLVGFLYLFTLFLFIIPGLVARGIDLFGVENLPHEIISGGELKSKYGINTDQVYPRLINKVLPVGLIGIILSAMISALTSNLSATLNSVSTLFTMDFYSKINPNASSKKKVTIGKITAVITLIIAILWAPYIGKFDSLIAYYQEILSYLAPPVVGTFFLGLFWKRSNATGALTGLMSGLFIAAIIMALKYIFGIHFGLHFLILAPIILVLSLAINFIVSLMTAPPLEDKVRENTWTRNIWIEETLALKGIVWYENFRIQALLLILACFGMYFLFY